MDVKTFNRVNYLWDEAKASELAGDEVALLLYRSNLLGADLRITNYGGGNTSCKTSEQDPLTGQETEVMWVKGSGGDLGTLAREGLASLSVGRVRSLKNVYKGLEHEDEMVALLSNCLHDPSSKAPSIDTPLHGLLPFKHIDHLHPDALIAIAAAKEGEAITREIWGDTMGWVPWQRPGFDLALQLEDCLNKNPTIRGIVLGNHGLFTWGDTSYECYLNSLETIEQASAYIEAELGTRDPFGGSKLGSLEEPRRRTQASRLAPILRGIVSGSQKMIGHFSDDPRVLEFVNNNDLERLAPMGTSCPDHFLRTKIQPLVLDLDAEADLNDFTAMREQLDPSFERYRSEYRAYYEEHKHPDSPPIRDSNPVVILWPRVGMFTFAKNKQTARVASEFYINAINVMRGAEAISEYTALPRQEAFDIEYWALEEAKLQRLPVDKSLTGRVALITGAAGGIGKAIANKLAAEGAHVVLVDVSEDQLAQTDKALSQGVSTYAVSDVTNEEEIRQAYEKACLTFGGADIIVHSAGLAISKPLEEHTEEDWDTLQDVLVKGQYLLAQKGAEVMRAQGIGGDIVNIASKNGLVAGPNNVAYGTAKAGQQHMTRLLATELARDNIRVNTVNPDSVIVGSKIWEGRWAEARAEAHGISVDELPEHYAKRNLLNQVILPEDVAEAVFAVVAILKKTTGAMINVDGGMRDAFVR